MTSLPLKSESWEEAGSEESSNEPPADSEAPEFVDSEISDKEKDKDMIRDCDPIYRYEQPRERKVPDSFRENTR